MKINPSKIGKYTFWVSFIIGNLFLFGFLFGVRSSAIYGFYYLYVATAINLVVLLALLIWGIADTEKRKQCFKGIGIMLINIPLAALYAVIGLLLL